MADNIGNKAAHDYHLDVPVAQEGFYVRGAANCDFGMKSRLARMFNPKSGNAVMLAFDHGYCAFCTISAHQGKFIVSRSKESILKEVKAITELPDFKGYLSDLGGPSANMYRMKGRDEARSVFAGIVS